MEYKNLILEKDKLDKRIGLLTLNRPQQLNALSSALLDELALAVEEVDNDEDIVVLIIKGAGRAFSAGYDLEAAASRPAGEVAPTIGPPRRMLIKQAERYFRMWNLRKPTIAQVHGYCISGATELIAMCDIVIAAEDARFGHMAGRDMGTLRTNGLFPYYMGMRKTKQLLFTGDLIDGKTAERWGLINMAVPANMLEEEAYDMARRIVRIPLELLSLHKATTNQFYEIMGIHAALMDTAFYAAVSGFWGRDSKEFERNAQEKGLKEALRLRALPWTDHKRIRIPPRSEAGK